MRVTSSFLPLLVLASFSNLHAQAKKVDVVPLIARNGGVEIQSIEIERRKVSYAVKSADFVNMTIALLLTVDGKHEPEDRYMMRLRTLENIEDDTGKLLTTKQRLGEIRELKGEVANRSYSSHTTGSHGPVMHLRLDAPARGASTLKTLKGTAEVRTVRLKSIAIADVEKSNGKKLDHTDLKDIAITPTLSAKDGFTRVKLTMPRVYWRIIDWGVSHGGKSLAESSEEFQGSGKDIVEITREFRGEHPKGCTLHLRVPVSGETKAFSFEFKNLELP